MEATIVFQKVWEAVHACNEDGERRYRYIILTGSSRSSKTASAIQVCHLYAKEGENKRITVWRDTKKDCKDTVLHDALSYMKMWGEYKVGQEFNKTESIFTYGTGSTFEIHGTDDEEKVMGLNKAVTWLNEPYKISRDTFDQLDQRTEDFVVIDWNPKKNHWIEDVALDPRAIVIHSTFKDNPFCPPEQRHKILSYQPVSRCALVMDKVLTESEARAYDIVNNPRDFPAKQIKELIRCRFNEDKRTAKAFEWDVYGLGLKAERPHRIFRWEEIADEEYHAITGAVRTNATDWGTVDAWGTLESKYRDGCLYLHERNYLSEDKIREALTPTERAIVAGQETEKEHMHSTGIVTFHFSRLGIAKDVDLICDNNRPRKIAALRREGYRAFPAAKGADSIRDGIDILTNIRVFYTRSSKNLEYEQENYCRKVVNGIVTDEPEDDNNHLIDPARYIAQHLQARGIIKSL